MRSRVLFARLSLCEKVTSDFKITYQVVTYQCEVLPLQNKSLVAGFGGEGWESWGCGWVDNYVQEQLKIANVHVKVTAY